MLPNCSKYIITYSDLYGGNIYAYENDLNVPMATPPQTVFVPMFPYFSFQTPDVAAIQHIKSGSVNDYAIFTWINSANDVMEAEWNCATGATTTPIKVLPAGGSYYCHPRIDAIDDYSINTISTQANYQIVANDLQFNAIAASNPQQNYSIPAFTNNITDLLLSGATNTSPCVAAGPGNTYSTMYSSQNAPPSNTGMTQLRALQTFDYSTGLLTNPSVWIINPAGAINSSSYPCMEPQAISTSANDHNYDLLAYTYNAADLTYRYNNTQGVTAYKATRTMTGVDNVAQVSDISVSPNPATDNLKISGVYPGDSYVITDMLGKQIMQGSFYGINDHVDVKALTPGTYFICIKSDEEKAVVKFVKEAQ